jgi:DMSO/TMAO reductase YedYZ molybdopterin-dependent catalytic subunit
VERPTVHSWESFNALDQVTDVSDFHCVTTWSKFDCEWTGVAFTTLAEQAGLKPEARFVYFVAFDGYTTNLPIEACLDDDVLIATRFHGEPLDKDHGGPARMIVPKRYAWKGAKWIRQIHFMEGDRLGFWEVRGYSNSADPFTEDRYS